MKILYVSCHKQLEENESGILRELGHDVDVIGFESQLDKKNNNGIEYELPGFSDRAGVIQPTQEYLKPYDLIISCFYPLNLKNILENYAGKVILRTINSINAELNDLYKKCMAIRPLPVVRMSERECDFSDIPTIAIVRESVDEDKFSGWLGHKDQILTVCKSMFSRWDIDFDVYNRVVAGFPHLLIGDDNPPKENILSGIDDNSLLAHMRGSKVNYVHPRMFGCMTYTFAESMVMGMPTVCLGRQYLGQYWMGGEYIQNGANGFCSGNLDETRFILKKILGLPIDGLKQLSYNTRETGIKLFGKKENKKLWEQIIQTV